jgi:protein-disulfide isomerase
MSGARWARASLGDARALALLCVLGSLGCGGGFASTERAGQASAQHGQIDLTSPGNPSWPGFEPEPSGPEPTDADVEQIAVRVLRQRVPEVTAQNPSKGPVDARVTLQIFSDFACPFCVRVAPALARIEARYRGRLRLVWRNYPLPSHERARPAARAALLAFELGGSAQFWKLHDALFSQQAELSDAGLRQAAARVGLDPARVDQALRSPKYEAQITADVAAGDAAGVEGTPAVFINDYYIMGAASEAQYAVVVERALREAPPAS